jgi:hypothetical protein
MVIGGVLFDGGGTRIGEVRVDLLEPAAAHGGRLPWSGTFDLEPHAAVLLMERRLHLRLRLRDGREGWCTVTEVDFRPGAPARFRGTGPLEAPAGPPRRIGSVAPPARS